MKHLARTLAAGVLALGCGGDDSSAVDANEPLADAPPVTDAPSRCDHREADDAGNDATAESTEQAIGDGTLTICGRIDARAPAGGVVDVDRYGFTTIGSEAVIVRLHAPGGTALAQITSTVTTGGDLAGSGVFVGNHLVYLARLDTGAYVVTVEARDDAAPTSALDYELEIAVDDPATRCVAPTGEAAYTEAADGAGNSDNDMVRVSWSEPTIVQTPDSPTADAPEPSGEELAITAGMAYQVAGELGVNVEAATHADDYLDRDTYLIVTGAQSNELTIRVAWEGDDADLDVLLFAEPPGPNVPPVFLGAGTTIGTTGPELDTTATLPSTRYWLWIGNFNGSAQPKPYEATLCGARFEP